MNAYESVAFILFLGARKGPYREFYSLDCPSVFFYASVRKLRSADILYAAADCGFESNIRDI